MSFNPQLAPGDRVLCILPCYDLKSQEYTVTAADEIVDGNPMVGVDGLKNGAPVYCAWRFRKVQVQP